MVNNGHAKPSRTSTTVLYVFMYRKTPATPKWLQLVLRTHAQMELVSKGSPHNFYLSQFPNTDRRKEQAKHSVP